MERHRSAGGIATLTVKHVEDTSEYGVVLHDADGRINGFQEKPDPPRRCRTSATAASTASAPRSSTSSPTAPFVDWAQDVFPALLENDVPFYIYETERYWNDVGSLDELRQGTFDVLEGKVGIEVADRRASSLDAAELVEEPVWVGEDVEIGEGVRLMGPVVIGDGSASARGRAARLDRLPRHHGGARGHR